MSNSFNARRSVASALMTQRVKQTLFILFACASLVVSTFGACLCSHHETEAEKTKLSCHSTSHETEAVQTTDPGNPKLESLCICVRESSPAIFNKSDRKKSEGQKEVAAAVELPQFEPLYSAIISKTASYPVRKSFQSSFHRISAPSRAPPRL